MRITQDEFDNIIDLLGDAANANAYLASRPENVDRRPAFEQFDLYYNRYIDAVTKLYAPRACPDIFKGLDLLVDICEESSTRRQIRRYTIDINAIMGQLSLDFKDADEIETTPLSPLYTGVYKDAVVDGVLNCDEPNDLSPDDVEQPAADSLSMNFLLQVLSHPVTPIMGAVVLLAGMAIMASGAGLVVGACVATAGAGLIAGTAATQFGFFSDTRETARDEDIQPSPQVRT